jgi:hypothetical protein
MPSDTKLYPIVRDALALRAMVETAKGAEARIGARDRLTATIHMMNGDALRQYRQATETPPAATGATDGDK